MDLRRTHRALITATLMLCASGCKEDSGEPPTISNLSLDPDSVVAGATTTVTASFDFVDADGDISDVEATVVGFGQTLDLNADIQGAQGVELGRAMVFLVLAPPSEGSLDVSLTVFDSEDNGSNPLDVTIPVTAMRSGECQAGACGGGPLATIISQR